ncbi:metallophosphoesterase [Fibrella forsythiae]|uniref:Metallophosphoesterase n=1 Tax=Fibrella forsythiae TaxID=2817061 RepID=A0ABS3JCD7_9BACT|nr:metallophosphoesterase [Fibrella forsythiae]MBO0947661.1 metallophosphoesterase [Fibrella forsythiae]
MRYTLRLLIFPLSLCLSNLPGLAQTIIRGPYLQQVTPTSVVVRWRTDLATDSRVRFGTGLTQQVTDPKSTTEHAVTLTGLLPATKYPYVVGTSTANLSPVDDSYYVKTAPAFGSNDPVRLWMLGDFGTGSDRQRQTFDAIKLPFQNKRADLWIWLGDNAYTYGRDDEYQNWVFNYAPEYLRNLPFYATPGNHDYHDDNNDYNVPYYALTTYPKQGEAGGTPSNSSSYYSVDYGAVHLVSLDSFGNEDGKYRIWDTTGTQMQWLKRDLAANKRPWTIIVFHHPPYTQGSRNSDTEQDLILNRERLTPIFERYNVDLVVSGHSHVYERTYQMRGHRGLSTTFDKKLYAVDTTTGRYDGSANSCPIVQKNGSLVYIVNGSGGANTGRSPNYPHKAMVYSYTDEGGSMVIDASENRLDGQWVAPSGVLDRFTMVKNVNRRQSFALNYADTLTLTASWVGNAVTGNGSSARYSWSTGQTSRTIRTVNQSGTFRVTDGQGCLTDEYTVTVAPRPKLTTNALAASAYCPGTIVTLTVTAENAPLAPNWTYDIQLSDASGSFSSPRSLSSGTFAALTTRIPADLNAGTGYRLRAVPREVGYAEVVAGPAFSIKALPTAAVTGSATALVGQPASATVSLTGDAPWQLTFSNGTSQTVTTQPAVITFPALPGGITRLTNVSNDCGKGTVLAAGELTGLLPTAVEPAANRIQIYPNPTSGQVWIDFLKAERTPIDLQVFDSRGVQISGRQLGSGSTPARIAVPLDQAGMFFIQVRVGDELFMKKILRQP